MKQDRTKRIGLLFLLCCMAMCLPLHSQNDTKPLWVQKGEKALNKQRTNETYYFKSFNTYGMDEVSLNQSRFAPLLTHVRERYQADFKEMRLDSVQKDSLAPVTYRITFPENGRTATVYARLVDQYSAFEDYVSNTYQFEYYQLYAISEKDTIPTFDEYKLTRTYNAEAVALSLIPGMGQIYKGQKGKGYVILGGEAFFVSSAIAFHFKKRKCDRKMDEEPGVRDSWRSKSKGWRQMRNMCIGLAGGLYIYNLLDAAIAKGSRRVIVNKPDAQKQFSLSPMATPDGAGLAFVLQF